MSSGTGWASSVEEVKEPDKYGKKYRWVALIPLKDAPEDVGGIPFATSDGEQYLAACGCSECVARLELGPLTEEYLHDSLPLYVTDDTGQYWTFFTAGWRLIAEAHMRPEFAITPLFDVDEQPADAVREIRALFKALSEF